MYKKDNLVVYHLSNKAINWEQFKRATEQKSNIVYQKSDSAG